MTINVKRAALDRLADYIKAAIPELETAICAGQSDAAHHLHLPSLVIDPARWPYMPGNDGDAHIPSRDTVVMDVGYFEGRAQLILTAGTLGVREDLEAKLGQLFLETELKPGSLVLQVDAIAGFGVFSVSFDLEDDEWRDDGAFNGRFRSVLNLIGVVPALTTRKHVYPMDEIQFGLSTANSDEAPTVVDDFPDGTDAVSIDEDGQLTPA